MKMTIAQMREKAAKRDRWFDRLNNIFKQNIMPN